MTSANDINPSEIEELPDPPRIITVDGPTASGKSSAGFLLAQELDYLFLDTGILYRIVCYQALQKEAAPFAAEFLKKVAEELDFELDVPDEASRRQGATTTVAMEGRNITWDLRSTEIDQLLPEVSALPAVRRWLTTHMRRMGQVHLEGRGRHRGLIAVGRDTGTVVFPSAGCKFFLDGDPAVRARRRYAELRRRGLDVTEAEILADLQHRDQVDSTRATAPTRPASGAIILDTTHWSQEQTLSEMRSHIAEQCAPA